MIKAYTISGLKALKELPELDVVQFTLNSRTWPGKRQTVKALQEVSKCCKSDIYIHYDFIYIASRFSMFSEETKRAIMKEIIMIMLYAQKNSNIKGIVMHTDFSIRKEVYKDPTIEKIQDAYGSNTWNTDVVIELMKDPTNFTENNIREFYYTLKECWEGCGELPIKIYLENTTKISQDRQGNLAHLHSLISTYGWQDVFGICIDTEHYFAIDGDCDLNILLSAIQFSGISTMVHLNTIPEGVTAFSGKDRHSETTIFECSYRKPEYYFGITEYLEEKGIPYIREVHEDTMYRELEQIKDYESGNN